VLKGGGVSWGQGDCSPKGFIDADQLKGLGVSFGG